jgi:hypothetical protein
MSLNVLVTAAVQRTGQLVNEAANEEAQKKKRKRAKAENGIGIGSNGSAGALSNGSMDDEEEKQRKRRAQIAEASRRSRARRKKEFQDFKEENDQLWSQNMMLRKTLEDLGVFVPPPLMPRVDRGSSTPGGGTSHNNSSDDEDDDGNRSLSPSPTTSPMAMQLTQQVQQAAASAAAAAAAAVQHTQQLHWAALSHHQGMDSGDSTGMNEPSSSSPAGFQDFCQFFERRLSWYFTQLKSDAIRSFASHLPYEEKQKIASMQVKLTSKDGVSPLITPSLTGSAATTAARIASASSAEHAVDQDKNVRL